MTDEDLLADLKQFIAATVSQATADLATDLAELKHTMNQRFDELGTQVTTIADAHAEQLADHERRLTRLEHRPAA